MVNCVVLLIGVALYSHITTYAGCFMSPSLPLHAASSRALSRPCRCAHCEVALPCIDHPIPPPPPQNAVVKNEEFGEERPQNHHDSIHFAGGGVALLYASKSLDAVKEKLDNFDQTVGVQILQTALRVPLKTIADNAGTPCLLCYCCPLRCAGAVLGMS